MPLQVTKVDVWAGEIPDQPGGLLNVLTPLAEAGANIECVIARRQPDKPGTGIAYISPVKGRRVQDAARRAGLMPAEHIGTLRVEGPDQPGIGARITRVLAESGINTRGVSAATLGGNFVAYIGFDSSQDVARAARLIKALEPRRRVIGRRRAGSR